MNKKEAFVLLEDFENTLVYENRFFVEHEAIDVLKSKINQLELKISENTQFFRARIFNEKNYLDLYEIYEKWHKNKEKIEHTDVKENNGNEYLKYRMLASDLKNDISNVKKNFWGYKKGQNLKPPKEKIGALDGRGNPPYISYLYLANSKPTALAEVRPTIESKVSIATIKNKSPKRIIDISYANENVRNDAFLTQLCLLFSRPPGAKIKDYIVTQYITEWIKHLHFEGIRYSSSLYIFGLNYLFFEDSDFEEIDSRLYKVNAIYYDAECANADFEPGISFPRIPSLLELEAQEKDEKMERGRRIKEFFDNFEEE